MSDRESNTRKLLKVRDIIQYFDDDDPIQVRIEGDREWGSVSVMRAKGLMLRQFYDFDIVSAGIDFIRDHPVLRISICEDWEEYRKPGDKTDGTM